MQSLARIDAVAAAYLPDPRTTCTAETLDEAVDVVGRNIHPHRLRTARSAGGLSCLTSALDQSFNISPAEYVRELRIQALHEALLAAECGQSVTDLMQEVGIVNCGRYTHYYRQRIGVAPSVTLRRGS